MEWTDDLDSDSELDFSNQRPTRSFRQSLRTSLIRSRRREGSPVSLQGLQTPSHRLSTPDPRPFNRLVSIYDSYIRRQRGQHLPTDEENTTQLQLTKEERQENAIYKVYLKRVPKKQGSSSSIHSLVDNSNESKEHGSLLYSTIKIYQLKAGTLEVIVQCLTNEHGELDPTHMHILFATYRTYTTTQILIDTVLARYRATIPASLDMTEDARIQTLKSLSIALICLLTVYKEDFYQPPSYPILRYLCQNSMDVDVQEQCQSLLHRFGENTLRQNSVAFTLTDDVDSNNNSQAFHPEYLLSNSRDDEGHLSRSLLEMSHVMIAEQLTIMDADLFKRMLLYECLTIEESHSVRRGLNANQTLSTVEKTMVQFNAVVNRVRSTILKEVNERTRAQLIEKWIDIAVHCRQLKNFSSLKAILTGLLSGCIHRLDQTWSHIDNTRRSKWNQLKDIFANCLDQKEARAIFDQQLDEILLALPECAEGIAKYVDMTVAINEVLGKNLRVKNTREHRKTMSGGTVPYLGLYTQDLTYIHSAHPNSINIDEHGGSPQKLINFEKYRKKFEILAQIKLFQFAANGYTTLSPLPYFKQWFNHVPTYSEMEIWELSYQIVPKEARISTESQPKKQPDDSSPSYRPGPLKAFPSEVSLESLVTPQHQNTTEVLSMGSSPSSTSFDKISLSSGQSFSQRHKATITDNKKIHSNHSRSSSASSFLTSTSPSQGYMSAQASPAASVSNRPSNSVETDSLVVKVTLVGNQQLVYKKVRIGNNERTSSVLKNILEKFNRDPLTHDRYCIEQRLPGKTIVLLDQCTVYYAVVPPANDESIELVVREKTRQELDQSKTRFSLYPGHNRTPSGISLSSTHSR